MNKLRKILSLTLAVLMVLLSVPFSVSAANEYEITEGQTLNVRINSDEITYIKFVPTVSGVYSFFAISDDDTYGYLFDENKNQITGNDDGDDLDFKVTYDLYRDTIYYFGARYLDEGQSGSFDVCLTVDEIFCDHLNTEDFEAKEATCDSEGYTSGTYCNDCDKWITGHKTIPVMIHIDSDNNGLCDMCGYAIEMISLGNTKTIELAGNSSTIFKFVPEFTGEYRVNTSPDESYTDYHYITNYIYDSNMNLLTQETSGGSDWSCAAITDLTEGEIYYLVTEFYGDEYHEGSFNVQVACDSDICDHSAKYVGEAVEPTCTVEGFTSGEYCPMCLTWVSGHDMIEAFGHNEDEEGICKTCGIRQFYNIALGERITVDVAEYSETFIRFVPEKTARYGFRSYVSDNRTYGKFYDENRIEIEPDLDLNGTGGEGYNYDCMDLEAGKTYYYAVGYKDVETSGSFDVKLIISQENCDHINTYEVEKVDSTCYTDGHEAGVLCNDCEGIVSGYETIYLENHNQVRVEIPAVPATCISDGYTSGVKCATCGIVLEEPEIIYSWDGDHINTTDIPETPATCSADGYTAGEYCNDCQMWISGHEIIKATGHQNTEIRDAKTATCSTEGCTGDKWCTDCDTLIEKGTAIAKKNHTETIISGYSATCTTEGLSDGIVCIVCNTVLSEQVVIPVTGHNDGDNDGSCDACGEDLTEGCSCNCHKTGFVGFFWKILRLFYKLFKTNSVCKCGAAHY